MGCAIAMVAANASARPVLELSDRLGTIVGCPEIRDRGHPPRLTLAICEDVEPAALACAFDAVFTGAPVLAVGFDRIGVFEDDPLVVWAAPACPGPLRALHARLHAMIDPARCRPHYRPGLWVPHCTLAAQVPAARLAEAAALARSAFAPFTVTFDRADLVEFPSLEAWRRQPLVPEG